jgi:hypothetical protein
MKKPSSGLGIGLATVLAIVLLYFTGGVAIYADIRNGAPVLQSFPKPVLSTLTILYAPAFQLLFHLWPELLPLRP